MDVYEITQKVKKVEDLAKEFFRKKYHREPSVYEANTLVTDFFRAKRYSPQAPGAVKKITWLLTCGTINYDFINYANNVPSMKKFFDQITVNDGLILNLDGKKIEIDHMFATLQGYYAPHIPYAYSGWKGDLGTLTRDVLNCVGRTNENFDYIIQTTKRMFLSDNHSFPLSDLYSDIDGENLYHLIKNNNMSISQAMDKYYLNNGHFNRFNTFIDRLGGPDEAFYKLMEKQLGALYAPLGSPHPTDIQAQAIGGVVSEYIINKYV